MNLAPGLKIAERYELSSLLGQGSMGEVWSAKHTLTQRHVALKFLKEVEDPVQVRRFVREARAASAVCHPNVVSIHDVLTVDGGLALVMDLLEGETLANRVEGSGPLPLPELATIMAKIVSAVGAVHAVGITHRDLKPANVFLVRRADGSTEPMLLDFGICKLQDPSTVVGEKSLLTQAGEVIGTPAYMAPEQVLADQSVDARADVWSLGVMLYECASGTPPLSGETLPMLVRAIVGGSIMPLEQRAPELPPQLTKLVGRMLTRDRARRPAMTEVLQTLRALSVEASPETASKLRTVALKAPAVASAPAEGGGWFATIKGSKAFGSKTTVHARKGPLLGALIFLVAGLLLAVPRKTAPTPSAPAPQSLPSAGNVTAAVTAAATATAALPPSLAPAMPAAVSATPKRLTAAPTAKHLGSRPKLGVTNFGGRR
jgi:serine/threonine-protein kinase